MKKKKTNKTAKVGTKEYFDAMSCEQARDELFHYYTRYQETIQTLQRLQSDLRSFRNLLNQDIEY